MNLNEADIRVLINTVSEITGKNFIIDPRVRAKVTVVSAAPMSKNELYEVFLSVLQVHGFAVVPGVGAIKILPDINAREVAIPTSEHNKDNPYDQLVTRIVSIKYIAANQLVPIIRPLVAQQGHLAAYPPSNILVISDRTSNIDRILDIISTIDKPDNDEVDIIHLEYASASELVRILTVLEQPTRKDMPLSYQATITADERANSLLIKADKTTRLRLRAIVSELDKPLGTKSGNTKVFFLNYAKATDIVRILQGVSSKTQGDQKIDPNRPGNNQVDIQPDEANNAVVITGSPTIIKELAAVIQAIDIPRAQILIETIIAEVSTDIKRELGTNILIDGSGDGSGPIGGSIFSQVIDLASLAAGKPNIGDGFTIGIGDNSDGKTHFALVLKALQGDAATNVLSTPSMVTLDNVESEFVVAQEVPFLTGQFSSVGGNNPGITNPFQTVQRKDVGISMKVKPHINEGDKIKLEIQQEVSSVEATSASTIDITTNKRTLKTEVMVDDGQIIVLGGLIQDRFIDTVSKVPLLGSIPILGRLFSFNSTKKIKSNLMIFIRPLILKDRFLTGHVTNHKYKLLQARQLEAQIGKRGLIKDTAAKLPDLEVLVTPLPEKKAENSSTEKPKKAESKAGKFKIEKPATEKAATAESAIEEPAVEKPATETPTTEKAESATAPAEIAEQPSEQKN